MRNVLSYLLIIFLSILFVKFAPRLIIYFIAKYSKSEHYIIKNICSGGYPGKKFKCVSGKMIKVK